MTALTLNEADWQILKEKVKRKYNHLSEEDLTYQTGKEQELIDRLAERVKRKPEYILFTLKKGLANLSSNRL
ncbi:CsbD family protein [Olivibacter domesticus]|uniref:General stress protein CsbD n=1 Tax=Olivibacter domesticus TaxID=407022 RepID=A0A1H7RYB0_OLID1|nr:hypothetical protein [Olivibacter domesticus]SEL65096.1 hypothetical protein SAMN05661044_02990 [Olivibacter domesticus]